MTQSIHFEYMIAGPIIVPIASIHSEQIVSYNTEVLTAEFWKFQEQTRRVRDHGDQRSVSM